MSADHDRRPADEERLGSESAPTGDQRAIHQVRADGRVIGEIRFDTPVFVISVAAELAGMHAQTLRSYDRDGLVSPGRASGGGRRYSQRDIELLQQVQQLSQDDGVNRAGIRRIMELEGDVDALRAQIAELSGQLDAMREQLADAQTHDSRRTVPRSDAVVAVRYKQVRGSIVPWRSKTTTVVTYQQPDD